MPSNDVRRSMPLVSVLMNCYNGERYLRQAIESVLAQTYGNWEIVFWDNQSTDGSAAIAASCQDGRIKYFYAPRHTFLYEARNEALKKATGQFIAFLDVDDVWLPDKLERQLSEFDDPDIGMVCGNYWVESERNGRRWKAIQERISAGWVLDELLKFYFVGLLTLMVRRSALDSLDYAFDPRFHIIGDLDTVMRLAIHWKLGCVQEPVAVCRLHGGNESAKHRARHADELEVWTREMEQVEAMRSCRNFHFIRSNFAYIKVVALVLDRKRAIAYRLLKELPWGRLKFRICVLLLLPNFIIRRVKN